MQAAIAADSLYLDVDQADVVTASTINKIQTAGTDWIGSFAGYSHINGIDIFALLQKSMKASLSITDFPRHYRRLSTSAFDQIAVRFQANKKPAGPFQHCLVIHRERPDQCVALTLEATHDGQGHWDLNQKDLLTPKFYAEYVKLGIAASLQVDFVPNDENRALLPLHGSLDNAIEVVKAITKYCKDHDIRSSEIPQYLATNSLINGACLLPSQGIKTI